MRAAAVDAVATDGSTITLRGDFSISVLTLDIDAVGEGYCPEPDCESAWSTEAVDVELTRTEVERLRDALTAWLDRGSL